MEAYSDETLYENEWLTLKRRVSLPNCPGYVFAHQSNCNSQVVAVLPFRYLKLNDELQITEFLLREEVIPSWGFGYSLTLVTGRIEPGFGPVETAIIELEEETGYALPPAEIPSRVTALGVCREAKSNDTVVHLFGVDVTRLEPGPPLGDGTYYDTHGRVVVTPANQLYKADDPLVLMAWARLNRKRYV